jgi:hypothetical protein
MSGKIDDVDEKYMDAVTSIQETTTIITQLLLTVTHTPLIRPAKTSMMF